MLTRKGSPGFCSIRSIKTGRWHYDIIIAEMTVHVHDRYWDFPQYPFSALAWILNGNSLFFQTILKNYWKEISSMLFHL